MTARVCGWCGYPNDCAPNQPGKSPHHGLCCLDGARRECWPTTGKDHAAEVARREREDRE